MAIFQKVGQFLHGFFTWLRSAYSEPSGNGSSTRLHIALLTVFIITIGLSFGVLVNKKSITIEQFDGFLGAAATFLISTCGPLYGVNKLADWAKNNTNVNAGVIPPPIEPPVQVGAEPVVVAAPQQPQ